MKYLMTIPFALLAACAQPIPTPICDREAQEWDKFGTPVDECIVVTPVIVATPIPDREDRTPWQLTRTSSTPVEFAPTPTPTPEVEPTPTPTPTPEVEKPRKPIHHAYRSAVRERRDAINEEKALREVRDNAERGAERDAAQARLRIAVANRRLAQEAEKTTREALDSYDSNN